MRWTLVDRLLLLAMIGTGAGVFGMAAYLMLEKLDAPLSVQYVASLAIFVGVVLFQRGPMEAALR